MVIKGYEVQRWRLHEDYLNDENIRMIELYFKIKKYGWPFAGNWAEQPIRIFKLVEVLDIEMGKYKENGKR